MHGRKKNHEEQSCRGGGASSPRCRRSDLYGEVAGVRGRVLRRGHGEALEVAAALHLVLHLEVHVEGVGRVAGGVQAVARGAVAERGAVGEGAGVGDAVADLARVLRVGVDDAPLAGQVLDPPRRHERRVPALPRQVHGVLGLAVVAHDAPVALEVARRHALGVLVDEAEQVDLDVLVGHPTSPTTTGRPPTPAAASADTSVSKLASNTLVYWMPLSTTGLPVPSKKA
jgi:hypothetical protein